MEKLLTKLGLLFCLAFCLNLNAQSGNALVLNGTSQYMTVATHSDLNITALQSKTISCWIQTTSTASTRVFGKRSSGNGANMTAPGVSGTGFEIFLKGGTSPGSFVAGNAKSTTSVSIGTPYGTVGVNNGVWHHLALVIDNTTKIAYVYIDGTFSSQTATAATTAQDFSTLVNMVIGAAADASNKLPGKIDDFRIYNGALDATQIGADKNTTTVNGSTPNLLAAWDFEGITQTNVPDVSGRNHPGILTGYTMQYASTVLSQTNTTQLVQGSNDQQIIGVNIKTTNPNTLPAITLSQLNFTMNGTTVLSDVNNIKIYSTGSSNVFSTATQFGAAVSPAAGTLTATGSIPLTTGDNYFWIAYDVAAGATVNNVLDATCEGFVVGNSTYTLASPNNTVTGSRTIVAPGAVNVSFTTIPKDMQFFARNLSNQATISVVGSVDSPNIASIKVDFYRNNILRNTISQNLTYSGGSAPFNLSDVITAELAEYKIVVSTVDNSSATEVITTKDQLVAGDAYVVMGQSNSHPTRAGYTFTNEYLRSFGIQTGNTNYDTYNPADVNWGLAQANYTGASGTADAANPTFFAGPYMVGVWGLQMMEDLKNQFQIPICIINGGAGSSTIEQNLPGADHFDLTTVYGRMMYRVQQAGLQNNIKAMFWHQGEKNADGTFANYPANFDLLYNAWKTDLPGMQKVYVFQTNLNGCYGGASVNQSAMREWQRILPQTKTDVSVFPMAGIPGMQSGDGNEIAYCHYGLSGYTTMGSRVGKVVAKEIYSFNATDNVLPPNITAAAFNAGRTQITLTFNNSNLLAQAAVGIHNLKDYFFLDGVSGAVSTLTVIGNTVVLDLSAASSAQTISYLSNSLYNDNSSVFAGPYLTNTNNIGALTFNNFPITGALQHLPTPSGNVLKLINGGGSNQYMSVVDHADIDIASNQSRTITALVKTATPAAVRILSKRSGAGYEFITSASGIPGLNASDATGPRGAGFTGSPNIANNQWHHVAMVIDQSNTAAKTVKLYVDGVLISTGSSFNSAGDFSNAVNLIVGGVSGTAAGQFNGSLDNVRIWNKAMTFSEISADQDAVVSAPTANLLAAWDFEGVVGTNVPDVSGNSHPGTLVGSPIVAPVQVNMVVNSTTLVQTQLPTGLGDVDQRIIAVRVTTEGFQNVLTASALNFTMNGTTSISDVSNIKVYYTGSSAIFNTNTAFGSAITPAAGALTANGSQVLTEGDNYFWITYDVAAGATEGNFLDASCESIVINSVTYNPASNTVAGNRVILLANTLLFTPGDAGSLNYRIPAIITAADGSLVTVTDKRWNGAGDLAAKIDPVVRRSTDNGKTWSAPVVIANFGAATGAGDAAIVMDKTNGNLICILAANKGFFASTNANPIQILIVRSTDNGITWGTPVDITTQIYGPNPNWKGVFIAAGRAHQLRDGKIVAALTVREDVSGSEKINNYMMSSVDSGVTWTASTGRAELDGDEAKIVELNNGNLMMSIRNSGSRRFNISTDKGVTWGTAYSQAAITDPNCNGDFIRYTSTIDGYDKNRLLHSVPFAANRSNVSVLMSTDEGTSWPTKKTIFSGASAYSSLTVLPDGTLGMYYENGESSTYQMYFVRFSLNWLTNGADTFVPSPTLSTNNSINNQDQKGLTVQISPNPTDDLFTMNILNAEDRVTIKIVSLLGNVIQKITLNKGESTKVLSLGNQSNGVYVIQVNDTKTTKNYKIIKK
ncbi:exo-alpha-sialidase [Flavobacterium galactosidilyticum]|uniref:LamG-like jellyroll fold domain-containing protein n=1 Tax=Flavobacterium galactosidilyticum TaxID=2893886 RepID=UPI001E6462C3|nr:LamG-like jellyroll fold domain-containing protein [Flavobacterium sp. F-340]UFH45695.1 exo-alpha-sialidase [Flavobacterium sp. F-340]